MVTIELLKSKEIQSIISKQKEIDKNNNLNSWNIFTLSSYNNQYENFHSDIIASLLDPYGEHSEQNLFLNEFLEFLNMYLKLDIKKEEFTNVYVTREKGRIDIGIYCKKSKKCVILENKINNAVDMDNQLDRYINTVEKNGFKIVAIIYLSLDGIKKAPPIRADLQPLLKNIAAFNDTQEDLISGWLNNCYRTAVNLDSKTLIHQYIKIIKHISNSTMNYETQKAFYEYVSNLENLKTAKQVIEYINNLPTFRRNEFQKSIEDYRPFNKIVKYDASGDRSTLFENYNCDGKSYKLDVWFHHNGDAEIIFWIPLEKTTSGLAILKEKLKSINMVDTFSEKDYSYKKVFSTQEYQTMAEVDRAVTDFVKNFFNALKNLDK